jgi:hypothetical protein
MRFRFASAVLGLAFVVAAARADEAVLPLFSLPTPTMSGLSFGPPAPGLDGIWNADSSQNFHVSSDVGFGPGWMMTGRSTVFTMSPFETTAPRTGIVDTFTTPSSSGSHLNVLPGSRRP